MRLLKTICTVTAALFILELTTLKMWAHPAFIFIIAGIISIIYQKFNPKVITRRYVS